MFAGRSAVLDGEVVALDEKGRPSFGLLQHRLGVVDEGVAARRSLEIPATYMIFDLLYLDGRDLMRLPYEERRRLLEREELSGASWRTPPSNGGEGDAMLEAARSNRLEGIVAKRLESPYRQGQRTRDWLKIKLAMRQEFVVGGWVPLSTGARGVGSILVGYYDIAAGERGGPAGRRAWCTPARWARVSATPSVSAWPNCWTGSAGKTARSAN